MKHNIRVVSSTIRNMRSRPRYTQATFTNGKLGPAGRQNLSYRQESRPRSPNRIPCEKQRQNCLRYADTQYCKCYLEVWDKNGHQGQHHPLPSNQKSSIIILSLLAQKLGLNLLIKIDRTNSAKALPKVNEETRKTTIHLVARIGSTNSWTFNENNEKLLTKLCSVPT